MSEVFAMFANGTRMIFDSKSIVIPKNRTISTKKELRIAKAATKKSSLTRTTDRITKIKEAALS